MNKIILILSLLISFNKISYGQTSIIMKKSGGVYYIPCKVNGLGLNFVFDTGASDVSISLTEALFMLKNGYLKKEDIGEKVYYSIANGDIASGTQLLIRKIEFAGIELNNVKASIVHNDSAPLLLGQSALKKLGKIEIDFNTNTLTIHKGKAIYNFEDALINYNQQTNTTAKDGYKLNVTLRDNTDSLVYLCHYYGKGQTVYKDDSARLTPGTTKFEMKSAKKFVGGIYMLLFADKTGQFEFILSNGDEFSFELSKADMVKTASFKGSEENLHFYEYQKYLTTIGDKYQAINNELATAKTKADTAKVNKKSKDLSNEMKEYRNNFVKKYPSSFTAVVFNALSEPEVPEKDPMLPDGKTKDSTFRYRTFKGEYWNRFNFTDDRIIYTPLYEKKLEDYFKLLVPVPDSINKEADFILGKTKNSPDLFKYSLWWITRFAETSKVMGMDESFVYLVENYYQKGLATWLADSSLEKYIDRAKKIAPNMVGQPAIDVRLPDIDGNMHTLSSTYPTADYTLLVFWSPTCGHCQKEIPRVDSMQRIISKKVNFKIFAVETDQEDEKWVKLIKDNDLNKNWIHVHDPQHTSNFRATYDVYSTPVMYLIDKNGKIVGKKLDHSNIEGLIDFLEKKKKQDAEKKTK